MLRTLRTLLTLPAHMLLTLPTLAVRSPLALQPLPLVAVLLGGAWGFDRYAQQGELAGVLARGLGVSQFKAEFAAGDAAGDAAGQARLSELRLWPKA